MAHYAYINQYTNQVEKVLVIDKKMIKTGKFGNPSNFVECSYNRNIGKVFPAKGFFYIKRSIDSKHKNVFIPPRPFLSWYFNESVWSWEPPIPYPNDGFNYTWSEDNKNWIQSLETITIPIKPDISFVLNNNYEWVSYKSHILEKIKNNKIVKFLKKILL